MSKGKRNRKKSLVSARERLEIDVRELSSIKRRHERKVKAVEAKIVDKEAAIKELKT